jgi:DNA (cytosine-5)-methyltransferase 1
MLNGLSLFTGIGGLDVALSEWVRPLAYCEIDPYCQGVLLSRMAESSITNAPIWDDIRTLDPCQGIPDCIDIIYGGSPCQGFSVAGLGKGLADERSGLCCEIFRLVNEIKPRWIFLENVPAITTRGGLEVVKEIAKMGYDCRWITITASSVGALHKRERWFLLAHARRERFIEGTNENIQSESKEPKRQDIDKFCWGEAESFMDRKANGIPGQLDRIKALGNAVVPQQAKEAFKILMGLK